MRRIIVSLAVLAAVLVNVSPAGACSRLPSLTLEELLAADHPYGEVTGIYEQTHIAGTPSLGFRDTRTVSVVTRYWGQPPVLGREMHGDTTILGADSCGNESGRVGDVRYGYVSDRHDRADKRYLPYTLIGLPMVDHGANGPPGLLPAEEALLLETFGEPVELGIAWYTRIGAHAQLWFWPAVVGIPLSVLLGWVVGRLSRRLRPPTTDH